MLELEEDRISVQKQHWPLQPETPHTLVHSRTRPGPQSRTSWSQTLPETRTVQVRPSGQNWNSRLLELLEPQSKSLEQLSPPEPETSWQRLLTQERCSPGAEVLLDVDERDVELERELEPGLPC